MGEITKKKGKGVSLIYVLIVLSMLSVFSMAFIYFVKEKADIVSLKSRKESSVSENYLINKERQNSLRILTKGIENNGVSIFPEDENQYFNSKMEINPTGNKEIERIVFSGKNIGSIGGFQIEKITDSSGNEYSLPLDKNTVYNDLEAVYFKDMLGGKILFIEKLTFKRINPTLVEVKSDEGRFSYDE